ncbi:MAG TPA: hypothetical protein VGR21_11525, partial [Cryptosporangiaceae bacterium]|nr:hypothetical protein [Cryptosporangiaceae bacterium]
MANPPTDTSGIDDSVLNEAPDGEAPDAATSVGEDSEPERVGLGSPTVPPTPDGSDPAFWPPDVVWRPVSPRLATVRRLGVLVAAVPFLALMALLWWWTDGWWAVWVFGFVGLGLLAWSWMAVARAVRSWGYAEREDDLLVRHGVIVRRLSVVPYGRMQ